MVPWRPGRRFRSRKKPGRLASASVSCGVERQRAADAQLLLGHWWPRVAENRRIGLRPVQVAAKGVGTVQGHYLPLALKELASKCTLVASEGRQLLPLALPPLAGAQWLASCQAPVPPTQYKSLTARALNVSALVVAAVQAVAVAGNGCTAPLK